VHRIKGGQKVVKKFKAVTCHVHLITKKDTQTEALPNAVNVLGLHPAWSCDAIREIKSLTGLAMGGQDEI